MINHISKRDALGDIWMLLRQTEDSSEFFKEHMPGVIAKPVGLDEKEIKAIVDHWLR